MSITIYIVGIVAALFTLAVVIESLRRHHLRERHAVWWLLAGLVALVFAVFPGLLDRAASLLGVTVPINLAFFLSIAVLFLVSIQHSGELTKLEGQVRTLTEAAALQELRVKRLEDALESYRSRQESPRDVPEQDRQEQRRE
ncbi:DUF2304 domain-containing protein [Cnuibacter physcomitrellae]|uniref:DUF2304 domain-containing protein n=1 Tax=Cnuibacter physcomitrellae TaxID=1619308 RepID=UPI002175AAED|nr:DUF2304 domain-containing protein [Cnuibacter physcomitrellae]MCS5496263.1 DUF2304 domain-containing protein [Cnuibacter physcomitrellae]